MLHVWCCGRHLNLIISTIEIKNVNMKLIFSIREGNKHQYKYEFNREEVIYCSYYKFPFMTDSVGSLLNHRGESRTTPTDSSDWHNRSSLCFLSLLSPLCFMLFICISSSHLRHVPLSTLFPLPLLYDHLCVVHQRHMISWALVLERYVVTCLIYKILISKQYYHTSWGTNSWSSPSLT